ncbi:MAG TPA: universal stress protein [Terriglobales bacterium]|nr:universal stress protein [Terriglobales bacterium]
MSTSRVVARGDLAATVAKFQRILVATDFSSGARSALEYAVGMARKLQSKIFLIHAIPSVVSQYVSPEAGEEVIRNAKDFAAREMQRLVKETGSTDLVQTEILCCGGIWPQLQEFAKMHSVDLIVLGTHGQTAGKKRLLGPVAEEIFRLAERPVLTVGPGAQPPEEGRVGVRRILYATNFKPHAERAAGIAYALEREQQAELTVLHVVEESPDTPKGAHKIVEEFMVQRLKRGIPAVCVGKCEPTFRVRFGEPAEQILELARTENSDLIVLGMRSGKHTTGLLPSAVAYQLACQSPCPVLTIRR